MLKQRGSRKYYPSNRGLSANYKKDDDIIGYAPLRVFEYFSFQNPKHILLTMTIIVGVVVITYFSHRLLNDIEAVKERQKREVAAIEDLFRDEHEAMKRNHREMMESMELAHQKDIDQELQWFLDEMESIQFSARSLESEHKEVSYKKEAAERLHEFHSMEQKELDQKLNALYNENGDKIEHLNHQLIQCQNDLRTFDAEIARVRGKDPMYDLKDSASDMRYDQNDGLWK